MTKQERARDGNGNEGNKVMQERVLKEQGLNREEQERKEEMREKKDVLPVHAPGGSFSLVYFGINFSFISEVIL